MRNKMNQGHETLSLDSNRVGKWRIFVLNRMSLETSAANHYQNYPCTSLSPIYPKEELVKVHLVTFWRLIYSKKNNYFFLTEKKNSKQKYPTEQQLLSCSIPALCMTADFAHVFHFKAKPANGPRTFQDTLLSSNKLTCECVCPCRTTKFLTKSTFTTSIYLGSNSAPMLYFPLLF